MARTRRHTLEGSANDGKIGLLTILPITTGPSGSATTAGTAGRPEYTSIPGTWTQSYAASVASTAITSTTVGADLPGPQTEQPTGRSNLPQHAARGMDAIGANTRRRTRRTIW